jgi:hypothetical protein
LRDLTGAIGFLAQFGKHGNGHGRGVRQSLEQKVGLSPADPAFRYQTDKDQRASEPVPSCVRFLLNEARSIPATTSDGE